MDTTDVLEPTIDRLVVLHERDVRAALRRVLGRSGEEDDLVQEVFVRLVIRLRQPGELCVGAWLRGVAHNLAVDEVRRRRPLPVEPTHLDAPVASPVDEELAGAELWTSLVQGARGLPERQRRALVAALVPAGGASVASRLGVSVHAAESLLSRARSGLRLHLAETGSVRGAVAAVGAVAGLVAWLVGRWRAVALATVLTGSLATAALLPPFTRDVPVPAAPAGTGKVTHPRPAAVARQDDAEAGLRGPAASPVAPPWDTVPPAATSQPAPSGTEPKAPVVELPGLPALPAPAPCPVALVDLGVAARAPRLVPADLPALPCDPLPVGG